MMPRPESARSTCSAAARRHRRAPDVQLCRVDAGRPGARSRGRRRYRQHRSAARLSSTPYRLPLALPRLRRAESEGALAGVCAGIAKSLRVDATLVRLTFALLAFAGAPDRCLRRRLARARAGERPRAVAAQAAARLRGSRDAGAIALRGFGFSDSLIWPAALCGAGILLPAAAPVPGSWSVSRSRRSE